jgi:RNA polymerase sigma-70 factor (ECF subfamily)
LKYWGPVFAFVYSRLQHPQDAEDVAQRVFMRAYQAIKKRVNTGDERELKLKSWLFKIARNECINFQERSHQSGESLNDPDIKARYENIPGNQDMSAEERAKMLESNREMCIMLSKLPPPKGDVLALHYFFDMKCGEIAEILNIKRDTVKSHLSRGREKMNELIKKREQIIRNHHDKDLLAIKEWLKRLIRLL